MVRISLRHITLLAGFLIACFCVSAIAVDTDHSENGYHLAELKTTDEFNIRVALKRAIDADRPGALFHWHNPHTRHRGTITTLDSIAPRSNGRVCVNLVHLYYADEATETRYETMLCLDDAGNWNEIDAQATSPASEHLRLYAEQAVYDVQSALSQLYYAPGSVDGIYGSRTRRAIEDFQRDKGIPADGQITDTLLKALKQALEITASPSSAVKTDRPRSAPTETLTRFKPSAIPELAGDSVSVEKPLFQAEPPTVVKAATTPPSEKPARTDPEPSQIMKQAAPSKIVASVDPALKTTILSERADLAHRLGPFESIWLAAIAGFAACCIVGAFAAWFLTPKVNVAEKQPTDLEQDEDELKAKIALVTRRFEERAAGETERSPDSVEVHGPPPSSIPKTLESERPVGASKPERSKLASTIANSTDAAHAPADKAAVARPAGQSATSGATAVKTVTPRPKKEAIPTPTQDASETIKQADQFIDIIEAIKEAEELIKQAQQILRKDPLDAAAKDYITSAIKQATEVIKEAMRSGSIEGGSSQQITQALKNASELIRRSITDKNVDTSSPLRLT